MTRADFARWAVGYWAWRLRPRGRYPQWVATTHREWIRGHDKRRRGACPSGHPLGYMRLYLSNYVGMACRACGGVLVWASAARPESREEMWGTACHEVLHLKHPRWDEERVEVEVEKLVGRTPWREVL